MLHPQWQSSSSLGTVPSVGTLTRILRLAAIDRQRCVQSNREKEREKRSFDLSFSEDNSSMPLERLTSSNEWTRILNSGRASWVLVLVHFNRSLPVMSLGEIVLFERKRSRHQHHLYSSDTLRDILSLLRNASHPQGRSRTHALAP